MKISVFAIILSILGAFYSICLLVIPVKFLANYGVTLDSSGIVVARLLGAQIGGLAIIFGSCRNIPQSNKAWQNLLWGSLFFSAVSAVISANSVLNGTSNSMGWTTVAVQVLIALASCYFLLQRKTAKSAGLA
ncbi:MAG TPA: hypothetical protein VGG71_10580 [Chitinophagaceae bacterium]|jgi:hypothetical protein